MKKLFLISFAILLMSSISAIAQSQTKEATASPRIEAYYFHNAARCVTCKTVEAEAKADLESLYGNLVTFKAINLEDETTKTIAKKLGVSGQTLLVVKGNKQVNLTNEGFMYARTNPKKFKSIIKEKVDAL